MLDHFATTPTGREITSLITLSELKVLIAKRHKYILAFETNFAHGDTHPAGLDVAKVQEKYDALITKINSFNQHVSRAFAPDFFNRMMFDMQSVLPDALKVKCAGRRPLTWTFNTDVYPESPSALGILTWLCLFNMEKAPHNWSRLLTKLTVRGELADDPLILHEKRVDSVKICFDPSLMWSVGLGYSLVKGVRAFNYAELNISQNQLFYFRDSLNNMNRDIFHCEEIALPHELIHLKHHTKGHYIGEKEVVLDVGPGAPEIQFEPEPEDGAVAAEPDYDEDAFALTRGGPRLVPTTHAKAMEKLREQEILRGRPFAPRRRAKMIRAIEASFGGPEPDAARPDGRWNPEELMTVQMGNVTENTFRQEIGLKMRRFYG